MKRVCGWCGVLLGYKCPFCGEPLHQPSERRFTGRYMVCTSEPTHIFFAVSTMRTTITICHACNARLAVERRRQTNEDRANLAAQAAERKQEE